MEIIIKIEKEDIKTQKTGKNYKINIGENTSLIFTKKAIEELYNDMCWIDEKENVYCNCIPHSEQLFTNINGYVCCKQCGMKRNPEK